MCTVVSDKVALVIGNQSYERQELRGLFYAEKDAHDVTQALSQLGFKVRIAVDKCHFIVVTEDQTLAF